MADLATVVAAFERLFQTVTEGPAMAVNQHGEVYVTLCSGGLKTETGLVPTMYANPLDAVDAWWKAANDYVGSHQGWHLYWRHRPTLEAETLLPFRSEPYYYVVSRLVASWNNPPAPPTPVSWMRRWKCHKVVEAEPIVRIERTAGWVGYINDGVVRRQNVEDSFFAKGAPEGGDYLVRYEDGYLSWSPKKAFEDGYTLVSQLTAKFNPGPGNQYPELFKETRR